MKLIEISSIKKYTYEGKVFDLEVEDDHSYNINGIIVHNSDYIMLGSILNKALDSDSPVYAYKKIKINSLKIAKFLYRLGIPLYKRHVGMSTKEIQRIWNKDILKTAEGKVKWNKVEYTLDGWIDNFKSYIKSTMSYMNIDNINDLKYNTNIVFITQNALKRFNR